MQGQNGLKVQTSRLLDRTKELIRNRPSDMSMRKIARDTGISAAWITKMMNGTIENPGVISVEQIHDYLIASQDS